MISRYPDNDPSKIHPAARLAVEILPAIILFLTLIVVLYGYAGTWPPAVSIISSSMEPHMHRGDEVFIQSPGKAGIHTAHDSFITGYMTYGGYGDVIVYRPSGRTDVTPVIHRAIYWVNESEPMWPRGPPAPHSGYITLGDNNGGRYDQYPDSGICPLEPVREEWVMGVAKHRVPYLGYLRLLIPI
ncbi:S26 family signal peptidase [Methanocella arvoryzae]|uniref:Signal sequence peptidase n=1 Tax=Methanocella arvoryzae (strain DSM 22066 / NBRC 105507 / MRE50) TaxID=351160 RepID=Q0W660_METAR|nr:S26 family signal peptidase [Methanocella arvoryzae]CAH04873.1 signal sequence peptidase [uncultured archaeon]CAJ36133.1 signal sequence peptidase [Methanocella arvoryzae MRE50]